MIVPLKVQTSPDSAVAPFFSNPEDQGNDLWRNAKLDSVRPPGLIPETS